MVIKKSDLYSSLWSSCDELRGGMDASQYKDYVLTLLFMKYVTDKYAGNGDALIDVPEGGSFSDMVKLKGDKEIGDKINKIIGRLADANDLRGVIDVADFNDDAKLGRGQDMQDRLSKLIAIFEGLDFRSNRAGGDDLLGDAYEYLMRHFATESGKSKGQFYTPAEVSRILAKVVGVGPNTHQDQTIYDPTCGSGSLLLKAADEAPRGLTIYGQENDNATWALAKMNMILHGHPTAELWRDNTLSAPYFKNPDGSLRTFDFAVANPPFSAKSWSNGLDPQHDEFHRFDYGIPPTRNGDYAFLLHVISSLKSNGKAAIILPHGVLFRANKEEEIRKNLIKRGLIKGIIGLPPNLFYGTGIAACVVVIDKEDSRARTGIFMINASEGFIKEGNKNRLRDQDIHKIVDVFTNQSDLRRYSRMVPVAEITNSTNNYNLNIPRYIESSDLEDLQDIDAHMNGGIPDRDVTALDLYWNVFPSLRHELFEPGDRQGYNRGKVEPSQVSTVILGNFDFKAYQEKLDAVFSKWKTAHEQLLMDLKPGVIPREIIYELGEDLLRRYTDLPLLDKYVAYQLLMDYWTDVMQDDVYLIASDGWESAGSPRLVIDSQNKKTKETPDLVIERKKYKMDLVPPRLVVNRYFASAQATIEELEVVKESRTTALEDFVEDNSGEDGLLEDAKNEKGSITKAGVSDRINAIKLDPEGADERDVLKRCAGLLEAEAHASKALKDANARLDVETFGRYSTLSEADLKSLVVEDKWLAAIRGSIVEEVQHLTQVLAMRTQELEERYARTLPELEQDTDALSAKVEDHLKQMGVEWS